eukprot:GHVL01028539.1.p1 GENE.GHVL01028539.1~~GHVL01028539.1.p1  ORF type:complete len:372 (+),score=98.34 GHVL01028539.1:116-1117(+)
MSVLAPLINIQKMVVIIGTLGSYKTEKQIHATSIEIIPSDDEADELEIFNLEIAEMEKYSNLFDEKDVNADLAITDDIPPKRFQNYSGKKRLFETDELFETDKSFDEILNWWDCQLKKTVDCNVTDEPLMRILIKYILKIDEATEYYDLYKTMKSYTNFEIDIFHSAIQTLVKDGSIFLKRNETDLGIMKLSLMYFRNNILSEFNPEGYEYLLDRTPKDESYASCTFTVEEATNRTWIRFITNDRIDYVTNDKALKWLYDWFNELIMIRQRKDEPLGAIFESPGVVFRQWQFLVEQTLVQIMIPRGEVQMDLSGVCWLHPPLPSDDDDFWTKI